MKPSMHPLVRAFRYDLKLRKKLLISYLAIIIIPFVALAIVVSGRIVGIIEQRITYSADQAFQQAGAFLAYKLYNVRRISHIILVDPEVNAILLKDAGSYDLRAQRIDMESLTNYFFPLQDGVNITRVRLYVRDALEYAQENVNIFALGDARESLWFRHLERTGNSYLWCPSEYLTGDAEGGSDTLSLARFMVDLNDLKSRIGALRIDFSKPELVDILRKSSVVRDSCTFVRNSAGDVVAASDAGLCARWGSFAPAAESLTRVRTAAGEALVGNRELEGTDWSMTTVIPFAGIVAESRRIRNQIFLIIVAVAAAVTLLAYFISGSVTHRLSWIIEKMEGAKKGSLERLRLPAGNDEVGELAATYNLMIDEITDLIAREERTQRELKGAELKALQAQINPHFLYNTLDMIKWMSRKGMTEEIEDLLNSLATFYRLSLSEGRETIPIRDELRHVELYARIQNMRFRGALRFSVDVDERILGCGILKVTLQPLVENAILHGIIEKPSKQGRIRISGTLANGDISLAVEDDGVGMDDGSLSAILDPARARKSGFGVRNIHERFTLFYGKGYGLAYESAPGAGTRVTIRFKAMPAVQESLHV